MSKKNKYQSSLINDDDDTFKIRNLFIWIVVIIVVLIGFYFITNYVVEHRSDDDNVAQSVIQTEKIIFGQLFDRKYNEYYVLAYKNNNKAKDIYQKYISKYNKKDNHLNIFMINMDEAFNAKFISNKSNIVDDINELKVSDEILFKIKDKKIEMYKEGSNDISSYLKEISE